MSGEWKKGDFNRRRYTIESDAFDKAKKMEVKLIVDGQTVIHVQCREPGIIALVSKPTEKGIDVEIVEGSGQRFVDVRTPDGGSEGVASWQFEALGL